MPRFYEFFAGAGLVREGLGDSWRCVWANDISPIKAGIYRANFGPSGFVQGDVAVIDARSLPPGADMAWASFPCQDLSLAGWRRGMSAERSGTFWAFWRIMRDLFDNGDRPPLIVIENVVGLLYGDDFAGLCEAVAALGMQFGVLVIDAQQFVPQSRPRVFIVAVDERVDCSPFTLAEPDAARWFTKAAREAAATLPPHVVGSWRWWNLPTPTAPIQTIQDLIEPGPTSVKWHTEEETKHILGMMNPVNRQKVDAALEAGGRHVGFLYRRMREGVQRAEVRFDGVAGCLRTPKGGSSRQTVLVVENGLVRSRLLAPREAARLMGVRDSFELPPKYNDAYLAMGDGVVVPLVEWLSRHLLSPIALACVKADRDIRNSDSSNEHSRWAGSRRLAEVLAAQWSGPRE